MQFKLPLPITINQSYKTTGKGRFYKAKEAKDWDEEAYYLLKSQNKGKKPIKGKVDVDIWLYIKRDRDCDNSIKPINDALQRAGVIVNDKQVFDLSIHKQFVLKGTGCEITLIELEE